MFSSTIEEFSNDSVHMIVLESFEDQWDDEEKPAYEVWITDLKTGDLKRKKFNAEAPARSHFVQLKAKFAEVLIEPRLPKEARKRQADDYAENPLYGRF